jgi:hypothetical protein
LSPTTPAAVQSLASRIRLPPSPSGISDAVEAQTQRLTNKFNTYVRKSGIKKKVALYRQDLSSVQAINLIILIFEAVGLRAATLPWTHVGESPAFKPLGVNSYSVYAPNFFRLLTKDFWAPTTLWLFSSLLAPLFVAYFINLTYANPKPRSRKVTTPLREFDPLIFSITKGVLSWVIYGQGFSLWGTFDDATIDVVNAHIYGGYISMIISSAIGVVISVYDQLSFKS